MLQKNTIQLNKFLSQIDSIGLQNMFSDYDYEVFRKVAESFIHDNHIEYIIQNFPTNLVCKVYKARCYDFESDEYSIYRYKTDYTNLTLFYKIAENIETLVTRINDDAYVLIQEEIEREKNTQK